VTTRSPIETTTRIATTVDELTDAWAVVMAHVESVGPDPVISITPAWVDEGETRRRIFDVVVSGMVESA